MGKGKTNYILINENGETKEICGMREVANFLKCVDSTVYKYSDVGMSYNGWYITTNGMCDCTPKRVYRKYYKSKKRFTDINNNWHYQTFYPEKKTLLAYKSFKIPANKNTNYELLDLKVKKAIKLLMKKLNNDIEDYIVYSEIPTFFNLDKSIKYNIYYLELHFKFREIDKFYDWVNYLNDYILKLNNYIENYEATPQISKRLEY